MNLTLSDAEIKQAITDYVGNQGISLSGKSVSVDIKSGRKGNGYSAAIIIGDKDANQATAPNADIPGFTDDKKETPDSLFGGGNGG